MQRINEILEDSRWSRIIKAPWYGYSTEIAKVAAELDLVFCTKLVSELPRKIDGPMELKVCPFYSNDRVSCCFHTGGTKEYDSPQWRTDITNPWHFRKMERRIRKGNGNFIFSEDAWIKVNLSNST